jgi:hypothetical protein
MVRLAQSTPSFAQSIFPKAISLLQSNDAAVSGAR